MAKPSITVPDTTYFGTTVATVTSDKTDSYVFVECFQGDEYVYAAYAPVADGQATLGPLWSTLWPGGAADGVATHGFFGAHGFGNWKVIASTTFKVTAE